MSELLKVAAKSDSKKVAGAIAALIGEGKRDIEVQAVGAGSVNQAIKAIAIARGFVAPTGIDLVCVPAFTSIEIDGDERTAVRLILKTA